MQSAAQNFAVDTVFQQKTGPIASLVQALTRSVPGGYFVVPFVKTPTNILKAGIQASPAGFLTQGGETRRPSERTGPRYCCDGHVAAGADRVAGRHQSIKRLRPTGSERACGADGEWLAAEQRAHRRSVG
jgi:hypothetical protein